MTSNASGRPIIIYKESVLKWLRPNWKYFPHVGEGGGGT
jgi:hypothetical protein